MVGPFFLPKIVHMEKRAHTPYHAGVPGTFKHDGFQVAADKGHGPVRWARITPNYLAPVYFGRCLHCGATMTIRTQPATMPANFPFGERAYAELPISGSMADTYCGGEKPMSNRKKKAMAWHARNSKR